MQSLRLWIITWAGKFTCTHRRTKYNLSLVRTKGGMEAFYGLRKTVKCRPCLQEPFIPEDKAPQIGEANKKTALSSFYWQRESKRDAGTSIGLGP